MFKKKDQLIISFGTRNLNEILDVLATIEKVKKEYPHYSIKVEVRK